MSACLAEGVVASRKTEDGVRMGEELERLRNERGMTQQAVADAVGMSLQGYLGYRKGYTRVRPDAVERWARALDMPAPELAERLGIPLFTVSDASCLRRELTSILDPGSAEELDQIVHALADFQPSDRKQVIEALVDQVAGRHTRLGRP